MAAQRAPKRLDAPRYDATPAGGYPITLDELVEARMAGLVDSITRPLREEIAALRSEMTAQTPRQWGVTLNRSDAAAYLGVSAWTLDDLVRRGEVRAVVLAGMKQRSYRRSDLDTYVDRATTQ